MDGVLFFPKGINALKAIFVDCGFYGEWLNRNCYWYFISNDGAIIWWYYDARVLAFGGDIDDRSFMEEFLKQEFIKRYGTIHQQVQVIVK